MDFHPVHPVILSRKLFLVRANLVQLRYVLGTRVLDTEGAMDNWLSHAPDARNSSAVRIGSNQEYPLAGQSVQFYAYAILRT